MLVAPFGQDSWRPTIARDEADAGTQVLGKVAHLSGFRQDERHLRLQTLRVQTPPVFGSAGDKSEQFPVKECPAAALTLLTLHPLLNAFSVAISKHASKLDAGRAQLALLCEAVCQHPKQSKVVLLLPVFDVAFEESINADVLSRTLCTTPFDERRGSTF